MKCIPSALFVLGCGGSSSTVDPQVPLPLEQPAPAVDVACMPAGYYRVTVDLSAAQITQVNTGMADTEWCASMLMAVPTAQMNAMRIGYENGVLAVRWPPSRKVSATARSACEIEITDEPIPATIRFTNGRGEGTSTYSIGTANHPDERCTATGARLAFERTGE